MAEASNGDPTRSWFGSLGLGQLVGSASAAMRHMWLAFWLIIFLFIAGIVMNEVWGPSVVPGEFNRFRQSSVESFETWRNAEVEKVSLASQGGVFTETLKTKLSLFGQLTQSVVELRVGFQELTPAEGRASESPTVLGTLRTLFLVLPAWLWTAHGGFLCVYLVVFALLWSVFGGALSRQTIVEAATGRTVSPTEAMAFAWKRRWHYLLAPLMPLGLTLGMGLAISVFGVMFSTRVVDFLAAIFFVVALGLGAAMAVLLMGWFFAAPLMYPAISAEDTDFMDAATGRSYGMLREHPWRVLLYNFMTLGYGAVTYMLFGLFIFLSVWLTHKATSTFATSHFDHMFPEPKFGQLLYQPDHERLGQYESSWGLSTVASIVQIEVFAFISLLGAYAISFFFTAYSRIYLLLRQASFGAGFDEIHLDDEPSSPPTVDEKFEPNAPDHTDSATDDAPAANADTRTDPQPKPEPEQIAGEWKNAIETPAPLPKPEQDAFEAPDLGETQNQILIEETIAEEVELPFDPAQTRAAAAEAQPMVDPFDEATIEEETDAEAENDSALIEAETESESDPDTHEVAAIEEEEEEEAPSLLEPEAVETDNKTPAVAEETIPLPEMPEPLEAELTESAEASDSQPIVAAEAASDPFEQIAETVVAQMNDAAELIPELETDQEVTLDASASILENESTQSGKTEQVDPLDMDLNELDAAMETEADGEADLQSADLEFDLSSVEMAEPTLAQEALDSDPDPSGLASIELPDDLPGTMTTNLLMDQESETEPAPVAETHAVAFDGEHEIKTPNIDESIEAPSSAADLMDTMEMSLEEPSEEEAPDKPQVEVTITNLDDLQMPASVEVKTPDFDDALEAPQSAADLMDSFEMSLDDLDEVSDSPTPAPVGGSDMKLPDLDETLGGPGSAADLMAGIEDEED